MKISWYVQCFFLDIIDILFHCCYFWEDVEWITETFLKFSSEQYKSCQTFMCIEIFFFYFRNLVYNLSLSELTEQQRLTWYSNDQDAKMCVMKGKDEVSYQLYFVKFWQIDEGTKMWIRLIKFNRLIKFLHRFSNWAKIYLGD